MTDATCPYCGADQEINHDDGYGYEEDVAYEQECPGCEKTFVFFTQVSFTYDVRCQPEDHKFKNSTPLTPDYEQCERCGAARWASRPV